MNAGSPPIPTIDDVRAAADRLRGRAIRTPLLESALLNEELGCRLLLKAECLQRTGSFKFRAATPRPREIGRASCRERVCQYVSISVVAVSLKKKPRKHHP